MIAMAGGLTYGFFAERAREAETDNCTGSQEGGQKRTWENLGAVLTSERQSYDPCGYAIGNEP